MLEYDNFYYDQDTQHRFSLYPSGIHLVSSIENYNYLIAREIGKHSPLLNPAQSDLAVDIAVGNQHTRSIIRLVLVASGRKFLTGRRRSFRSVL